MVIFRSWVVTLRVSVQPAFTFLHVLSLSVKKRCLIFIAR